MNLKKTQGRSEKNNETSNKISFLSLIIIISLILISISLNLFY